MASEPNGKIYIFALMRDLDAKPVIGLKPRHLARERPADCRGRLTW